MRHIVGILHLQENRAWPKEVKSANEGDRHPTHRKPFAPVVLLLNHVNCMFAEWPLSLLPHQIVFEYLEKFIDFSLLASLIL